ncbi:restriction endonuclease subunit S [Candidatus Contendibacter odensensis]|uniref:Restriction modification system DNA specificity domain protein n=1 Tax=Candidatus Contendobacter odensis Run_B_J11 TaxID=1400861 RepID=A0A7U7GBA1_9GAMM
MGLNKESGNCCKLTIGRVAIAGRPLYTNEAIASLIPNSLNPDYLRHGLQYWDVLQGVDQAIKGATLNKEKLNKIKFQYPASDLEQQKIAEILSTVDRAIEQTEALIAKQQRIKTGLMQDLLTRGIDEHGNLRSEETHEFKDSPLGRIPVEWEVEALDDCVEFWDGKRIPLKQDDRDQMDGEFPYYGASGIIDHIDKYLFDDDLILVGEDGENVISRHLPLAFKVSGRIWVNNQAHVLKPKADQDIDFLTNRLEFYDYSLLVSGSAQPKLNQRNLRQMQLPIPPRHEQSRIGLVLTTLNKVDTGRVSYLTKLHSLKTALMQDLLTGKVRVTPLLSESA